MKRMTPSTSPRRQAGGAAVPVLLLLLVIGGALGWNYNRNLQIERAEDKGKRPYVRYAPDDLAVLAEGYRQAIVEAEASQIGGRVATRDRYHFDAQIREFERVQRETRKVRDRAVQFAELKRSLEEVEQEQRRRRVAGADAMMHLKRLFRI